MSDAKLPAARVCKALQQLPELDSERPSVYLEGPLELCTGERWVDKVIERLLDLPVTIFDPRRDDLETLWQWTPDSNPHEAQVQWELKHQEVADIVGVS